MNKRPGILILFLLWSLRTVLGGLPVPSYQIALLKYNGGGDWYANPTSLPNLVRFTNKMLGTNINEEIATVEAGSSEILNYPFVHMTGHGNVIFSDQEVENLRTYLMAGGFLHIDDNYGLDEFIRPQIKRLFPEVDLIELPFDHPIYHQKFNFPAGLPKIHEHDGKAPRGFGIIYDGRLVIFYSYECDLGDGWEDPAVHGDPETTRLKALQMGSNILSYIFSTGLTNGN
ncbi:MAG: DUF4159 domain-containing protein [Bacteroidales bacterium]|nr:DUF4159 domain-containing protein [Bacteroidales bacterium]HNW73794.1 DUF4159 domain-containing protein [Bacteroidales bacterium]HPS50518.1 DUF4159 domain-containing protein [Bacteroidales bacterium]